jgi:hypothetical protein
VPEPCQEPVLEPVPGMVLARPDSSPGGPGTARPRRAGS